MQGEGTLSRGFPQRPLPRPRAAEGRASARTGQQDRPEEQRGPQGPLHPASAGTDRHEGSTVSGWREPWGTGPCSRTARGTLSTAPWQRAHRCLLCVVPAVRWVTVGCALKHGITGQGTGQGDTVETEGGALITGGDPGEGAGTRAGEELARGPRRGADMRNSRARSRRGPEKLRGLAFWRGRASGHRRSRAPFPPARTCGLRVRGSPHQRARPMHSPPARPCEAAAREAGPPAAAPRAHRAFGK